MGPLREAKQPCELLGLAGVLAGRTPGTPLWPLTQATPTQAAGAGAHACGPGLCPQYSLDSLRGPPALSPETCRGGEAQGLQLTVLRGLVVAG